MQLTHDNEKRKPCTKSEHRSCKSSAERFAENTRPIGYQYALSGDPPILLATCIHCGTTLSRKLSKPEIAALEMPAAPAGVR
jgi:hypothetical protein